MNICWIIKVNTTVWHGIWRCSILFSRCLLLDPDTFRISFIFIMLNGVLGALYGVINMENVNEAKAFANEMWLGEIMLAIVGFYFGGGLFESARKK